MGKPVSLKNKVSVTRLTPIYPMTPEQAAAALDSTVPANQRYEAHARKTDAEKMVIALQVLSLMRLGKSLRTMGDELGMNHQTVAYYRDLALSTISLPLVDEARKEQLEVINALIEANMDRALSGDDKAFANIMRAMERKAKLTGTDKPMQVDAVVTEVSQQDRELQEMLSALEASGGVIEGEVLEDSQAPSVITNVIGQQDYA